MTDVNRRSRWIEDAGFLSAVLLGLIYGVAEALAVQDVCLGGGSDCGGEGIPWGLLIVMGVMALPKTLGRASAGKVWEALGAIAGRRNG